MALIPTRIVPSAHPVAAAPQEISREFRGLLGAGARLLPVGTARRRPRSLLSAGYTPKHRIDLFGCRYYLTNPRQNEDIRFFVGYFAPETPAGRPQDLHPRIFYKDMSLVWRSASHFVRSAQENWIGKGDVTVVRSGGFEMVVSAESTTDLPLEVQSAFEGLSRDASRVRHDVVAISRVLRRAPDDRIEAYSDFTAPRRAASADRRNLVNGGRPVARFTRKNDPKSLRFVKGFEPDWKQVLETSRSRSSLYGGAIRRFRILSRNRRIQYLFMAAPHHAWIVPPQATTTELSSYGLRTVDVHADDDLFVPGWEYHIDEEDGGMDQIPPGFVGERHPRDDSRCDASPWLDQLPVIREFRRRVLEQRV